MERRRQDGFSLVELAVVLVVAGLILAIGAPSLRRYLEANKVADAARKMTSDMRLARQKAVTNGTRNYLFFGSGSSSNFYWTGIATLTNATTGTWAGPVWTQWTLPTNTKNVVANFGGVNYFCFAPDGRAYYGLPLTNALTPVSGSMKVSSNFPTVHDTTTINLDLTGEVWQ